MNSTELKKAAFHGLLAVLGVMEAFSTDDEKHEFRTCASGAWAGFHLAATLVHLKRSRG